jgi:formate dehydrogenase subunit delta
MKIERLIKMANDIGNFFDSESDKNIAANGIKDHIKRSWEPRMRKLLLEYAQADGSELSVLVRDAVSRLQAETVQS